MAAELLDRLLSEEIKIDDFKNWLSNISIKDSKYEEIEKLNTGHAEFVIFFLNHLRDQTSSILNSSTTQPTPRTIQTPRKNSISEKSQLTPRTIQTSGKNNICEKSITNKSTSTRRVELFPDLTVNEDNFPRLPLECTPIKTNSKSNSIWEESTPNRSVFHSTPKSDIQTPSSIEQSKKSGTSLLTSSFNENTTKQRNFDKRNSACFGDFIVERKNSKGKRTPNDADKPRRIKPTSLFTLNSSSDPINNKNDNPLFTNIRDIESNTIFKVCDVKENVHVVDDRNLLRAECLKISTLIPNNNLTPTKKKFETQTSTIRNYIKPSKNSITFMNILNIFIEIYLTIIENNLILNLINELYFIISLLLACQKDNEYQEFCEAFEETKRQSHPEEFQTQYLNSLHNCVYFACEILLRLQNSLQILDRPTLKVLQSNERVQEFSPELRDKLMKFYQQKLLENELILYKNSSQNCVVRFISDTDNRNNFSSSTSFHAFRKQRDLFYEILRTWEQNHLNATWNFKHLQRSIQTLMNLNGAATDPINFLHLARLFKYQMLSNCAGFDGKSGFEEDKVLCSSLKNVSATKLSLLQSRLTTRQTGENSNDFPGHQEFYKDFLTHCEKPQFLRHLMDSFISEIHQLYFDGFHFENLNSEESPESKYKYSETIVSLKLLSKFLSFIECLSYTSVVQTPLPENLISIQHDVRAHVQNQLNLHQFLYNSIQNHTLILTIPWICDYFAMQDSISIRLPCNKHVLHILFEIYYHLRAIEIDCDDTISNILNYVKSMPFLSLLYLKICLGWLFERPHFPEELFFKWLTNKSNYCALTEFDNSNLTTKHVSITSQHNLDGSTCLDLIRIIDERILYKLCPYLTEIRQLVMNSELNLRSSKSFLTSRHITPVSTISFSGPVSTKQLELQLEETFFNSHPGSTRKTVEFVSDRIASACIKNICNNLVPNLKEQAKKDLMNFFKTLKVDEIKQLENIVQKQARIIADNYYSTLCTNCSPKNLCEERCQVSLGALLGDLQEPILKLCIEWTIRHSKEKILQWIQSHVSTDIFLKCLNDAMKHFLKNKQILNDKIQKDDDEASLKIEMTNEIFYNTLTPLYILNTIREIIWKFMDREINNYSMDEFYKFLKDIEMSMTIRTDYIPFVLEQVINLTIDLALAAVTFSPNLMKNPQILNTFITVWKIYQSKKLPKEQIKQKQQQPIINNTLDANNINMSTTFDNNIEGMAMTSSTAGLNHDNTIENDESISTQRSHDQDSRFSRMICSRNIFMLEQSEYPEVTWTIFGELLFAMVYQDTIINSDDLESQCTGFFHNEWPQVILKHFSIALNKILEKYKRWKCSDDKFVLLLEFLSETSCNMNELDDLDFM